MEISFLERCWRLIDRLWRFLGTALSFVVFGLGAMTVSVGLVPLLWLSVHPRAKRIWAVRAVIGTAFGFFIGFMNRVGVLRYSVHGLAQIDRTRGYLVVANHPSLIDVIFLLAVFRQADCVVKAAHWSNPCTMGAVRGADYVSNSNPETLICECIARLRAGRSVILFPEGTRSVPSLPLDFKRGAATVALRAGVAVLPVRIRCMPTTLTKNEPWYRIPPCRVLFEIVLLEPIDARSYLHGDTTERQASLALTERLLALLATDCELHRDP